MDQDQIRAAVATGVREGIESALRDRELVQEFWKEGYLHLSEQAGSGASQWVGRRILTAAAFAALGLIVAWLVKSGALK